MNKGVFYLFPIVYSLLFFSCKKNTKTFNNYSLLIHSQSSQRPNMVIVQGTYFI